MNPVRTFSLVAVLAVVAFGGPAAMAAFPSARAETELASVAPAARPEAGFVSDAADYEPAPIDPAVAAENREASRLLKNLAATYQHLDGVTVSVGETPKNEQAVAYYTDGEILIDTGHSASIDEILAHEVWHVIDWRDNGQIDWGEDLPPSNSSDYLSK